MSAGVRTDGADYWFHIDIAGGYTWRLLFKDLGVIHALNDSYIYQNGSLTQTLNTGPSVWEYSITHPDIGGQIGNADGNDTQDSLTFTIDSSPVTPTATLQSGTELKLVRVSTLDDGVSDAGTATATYTMTDKLVFDLTIDWINSPSSPPTGLVGMWPFGEFLDRGYLLGWDVLWALDTATAGNLETPVLSTRAAMAYEDGGGWGQLLTRDNAVDTFIQDRTNLGKFYPSESPTPDGNFVQVWEQATYRIARVGDYATEFNLRAFQPT